jgi:hypothetical protein
MAGSWRAERAADDLLTMLRTIELMPTLVTPRRQGPEVTLVWVVDDARFVEVRIGDDGCYFVVCRNLMAATASVETDVRTTCHVISRLITSISPDGFWQVSRCVL